MTENVVSLVPTARIAADDCIVLLEGLLEMARDGTITCMAYAASGPSKDLYGLSAGAANTRILGSLHVACADMARSMADE